MRYLNPYEGIPLKILRFLVGKINSGGRVIHDKDGKLISEILAKYFDEKVFDNTFSFSKDGLYKIREYDSKMDLMEYLGKMPLDDNPSVFGLHANVNISLHKNTLN